eukprot:CAMPEP_0170557032 /NCGR_PEP_ID=MMETSP0211-20121228/19150_1 /TAXON_ID=311385 /ORGANISM="Pseudokeronopsis sp., Strain OXSARD2" /LENGTH=69 /DNA_ID=CAMNT_0010867721 /DNA_START=393 /DNA_END=602 /DNA_ORIENTATION=+
MDNFECEQSFERQVFIEEDKLRIVAYCMVDEDHISFYDSEVLELKKLIFPEQSSYEWRSDGKVLITLKK